MLTATNAAGGAGAATDVQKGVDINSNDTSGIAAALAAVKVGEVRGMHCLPLCIGLLELFDLF